MKFTQRVGLYKTLFSVRIKHHTQILTNLKLLAKTKHSSLFAPTNNNCSQANGVNLFCKLDHLVVVQFLQQNGD
jgi:hypothetical protein